MRGSPIWTSRIRRDLRCDQAVEQYPQVGRVSLTLPSLAHSLPLRPLQIKTGVFLHSSGRDSPENRK